MSKKLIISTKDKKIPFPAAVRDSKTPGFKLSVESDCKRSTGAFRKGERRGREGEGRKMGGRREGGEREGERRLIRPNHDVRKECKN